MWKPNVQPPIKQSFRRARIFWRKVEALLNDFKLDSVSLNSRAAIILGAKKNFNLSFYFGECERPKIMIGINDLGGEIIGLNKL